MMGHTGTGPYGSSNDRTFNREQFRSQHPSDFMRYFKAKLEALKATSAELRDRECIELAEVLMGAGFTLVPSEHLRNNEVVVSNAVYRKAKELCKV